MISRFGVLVACLVLTPVSFAQPQELLNDIERQWLDSLPGQIIVATETDYQPYNFVDENGELSGVVGDYMALIGQRLGVDFEVRAYATFAEVLEAARNREVDLVPLILASPERRAYLDFTQPAYETRDSILTRQELTGALTIDDLDGMRVGVGAGYALQFVIEEEHPEIELVPVATELEGLLALSGGTIDVLISEIGTSSYYIQQEGITNLRVAGEVDRVDEQTIGTRSDWPLLNSIIGKGLASISREEHEAIKRRWISIGGVDPSELDQIWKRLSAVAAVLFLAGAGMLVWNLALRKLVARRTVDLRRELAERHRVEAARERLAVAVQQSVEYVLIVNREGNIEYANPSFLQANGVSDLRDRQLRSLATGEARSKLIDAVRTVTESGTWRGRVELERVHEAPMRVAMTISPILDAEQQPDGYVITARDVTSEERLEARLRQREKLSALGTLARGIAHDFNNLLVPIQGYTDLIRLEETDSIKPYLDSVSEASERARDLVQRILLFGRGRKADKLPLDLRFEVERAIEFVENLLPDTITIEANLTECAPIMGDRTQLQQVLLNLCTNAVDAIPREGGILTIGVESYEQDGNGGTAAGELEPGTYAVLSVSDTGVGMEKTTLARAFDPYFSEKQRSKGTGLGLAIVHGIVRGHGGLIRVDSDPGRGTDVRIYLPTISAQVARLDTQPVVAAPRGDGECIMIVDDEKRVLDTVSSMVQGLGYKVAKWADPVAALEALNESPGEFSAILTDLTMPGVSGIELAKRALEIRPDIPVAIMTGDPLALEGYAIRCVDKPIPLSALANCLHEILQDDDAGS